MVQYHDDIPEIVARKCSSSVEYYGVFKNWDAYCICGRFKSPLLEGLTPITGYPQYPELPAQVFLIEQNLMFKPFCPKLQV